MCYAVHLMALLAYSQSAIAFAIATSLVNKWISLSFMALFILNSRIHQKKTIANVIAHCERTLIVNIK